MKFMQWIGSLSIFISGYFPLALIYTIQNMSINATSGCVSLNHPTMMIILWVVVIICCIITIGILRGFHKSKGKSVTICSVSNKSGDLLLYTLPYLLALLTVDFNDCIRLLSYAVFIIILFYLMAKTNLIFLNPFLLFLNYNLYQVEYNRGDSSKNALFLAKKNSLREGSAHHIKLLGDNVFIVTDEYTINDSKSD